MGFLGDLWQGVTHPADTWKDGMRVLSGHKTGGRQSFAPEYSTRQFNDPTRIGGGVGTYHYNGNDPSTLTGQTDETQRYRGLGEAAARRQTYQADFGRALADEQQGLEARGAQQDAVAQMRLAAQGGAPSQAAILGNQAAGQSLQAQMAAGANARGLGQAAAQMQAAGAMGQQQLGAMGQYAGMRGAEMGQAQGAFGQAGGALRAGDYSQQAMAQQRAEAQGQAEATQRRLNQEAQMGYEQMGINTQQAQSDSDARNAALRAHKQADDTASKDARDARDLKAIVGGMSAVATLGTGSDERMKQDVVPLSSPPKSREMLSFTRDSSDPHEYTPLPPPMPPPPSAGDAHEEPAPRFRSSGRTTTPHRARATTSDERAKGDVVSLYEAPGTERHYDRDVAAQAPSAPSGASLSGTAPRYSAPAGKPSLAQAAAKQQRKPTDAELKRMADEMLATQSAQHEEQLAQGPAVSDRRENDMGAALEQGFRPFEYEYKPGFREAEGQQPGEKNVGPMAQDMASNPITGSAVKRGPDGLLMVDIPKATKVNSAGIGYLAAKQRQLESELARMKGGR